MHQFLTMNVTKTLLITNCEDLREAMIDLVPPNSINLLSYLLCSSSLLTPSYSYF